MAAITICSDFGAQKQSQPLFPLFPHLFLTSTVPITSWQIDGVTVETVGDFIILGSKITADGDCSHEIKRCSLEEKL